MRRQTATLLTASLLLSSTMIKANSDLSEQLPQRKLENELRWLQEENYVETATKTKENIKKSGASVTVITVKQLKQMGASTLMDALNRITGFNVQTTNIGIPAISVRGAKTDSSEKILFLINGHSINNNLVNGGATWAYSDFRIDDIKRVEVVRGPGSALYGTSALVAIINIVTNSAADIDTNSVSTSVGSDATRRANVQYRSSDTKLNYALNLNISSTEGSEEHLESDALGNPGRTKDNENRLDLSFNAQYHDFALQGKYIERKAGPFVGIGNALNDESVQDYQEYFIELSYESSLNNKAKISATAHYDYFQAQNYWEILSEGFLGGGDENSLLGSPTVKNEKLGAEVQLNYQLSETNKFLAGLAFDHHTQFDVKHFTNFDPTTGALSPPYRDVSDIWNWNSNHQRDVSAVYLQNIWDLNEDLRVIIGARNDHYSDFGSSFNPRASFSWKFLPKLSVTGIYGQAFRAPNFGELYNVNNPVIEGDPNLKPEEIETFEFILDNEIGKRTNLKATYFHNNIKNIIDQAGSGYRNNDRLITSGIEVELKTRLKQGSNFNFNYTYQYPKNMSQQVRANGIPMHVANAAFTYRHSRHLSLYIASSYRSSLKNNQNNEIDAFSTIDLAVNWEPEFSPISFNASIYNLFDKQTYDYAGGFADGLPGEGQRILIKTTLAL